MQFARGGRLGAAWRLYNDIGRGCVAVNDEWAELARGSHMTLLEVSCIVTLLVILARRGRGCCPAAVCDTLLRVL